MKATNKKALTPRQAAEVYGIAEGTLANWRYKKIGPKYHRIGEGKQKRKKILYFIEDFEAWLKQNPMLTVDSIPETERKCE